MISAGKRERKEDVPESEGDTVPLSSNAKFDFLSHTVKPLVSEPSYCNFIHWSQSVKYLHPNAHWWIKSLWSFPPFWWVFQIRITFIPKCCHQTFVLIYLLIKLWCHKFPHAWFSFSIIVLSHTLKKKNTRNILVKQNMQWKSCSWLQHKMRFKGTQCRSGMILYVFVKEKSYSFQIV